MNKNTLETYVREFQKETRTSTENNAENSQQQAISISASEVRRTRKIVVMEVDLEILEKLEKLKNKA